ncbi:MAG: agmatine deiminase family protein [Pseudomonadota bacterium]
MQQATLTDAVQNLVLTLLVAVGLHGVSVPASAEERASTMRIPAEWEPQAATWLQWPGRYETMYEPAFAEFSAVISRYQPLHILVDSKQTLDRARRALTDAGADPNDPNIRWHRVANDNAWMRDNGPVYAVKDGELRIQNWGFDAWGGAFGDDVPFADDDRVPVTVGEILDLPVDRIDIVHERGNLEFNGSDTVLLNWSTIGDPARNPGYSKSQAISDLKQHFGVQRVVMVEGYVEGERTRGHIDGFARFINADTVVVAQCTATSDCRPGDDGAGTLYDRAASTIAEAGFNVIRDPILGSVQYRDAVFDANYLNWLVGNGFVITVGFGDEALNAAAKQRIESYFPGRDVYVIDMLESWYHGGGVHCHTNDQPAL